MEKYDCYDECSFCGKVAPLVEEEGFLVCEECSPAEHLGLDGEPLDGEPLPEEEG